MAAQQSISPVNIQTHSFQTVNAAPSIQPASGHLFTVAYIIYVPEHMFISRLGMRRTPVTAFTWEMQTFDFQRQSTPKLGIPLFYCPLSRHVGTNCLSMPLRRTMAAFLFHLFADFHWFIPLFPHMEMWKYEKYFSTIIFVVVLPHFYLSVHKERNTLFLNIYPSVYKCLGRIVAGIFMCISL